MLDVLVIGAGLSGLCAALSAAQAGLRVRVVAKGLGALHWHAGTIDALGYMPGSDKEVIAPLDRIDDLPDEHPYRLIGRSAMEDALSELQCILAQENLPYRGAATPGENLRLISPIGAARPCYLAPQAQLGGDMTRRDAVLVAGFAGVRDFYPMLIAENLQRQGIPARGILLPYSLLDDLGDRNTVQIAQSLEDEARIAALAAFLRREARPGERIGLPALIGLDLHTERFAALAAQVGAPLFEIPTLPTSVPGFRLYRALTRRLTQLGVRVEPNMTVIQFHAKARHIHYVETETSARPLRHRAETYVLATGGVLGGGFASDHTGRFWESIFDLPLIAPANRAGWFHSQFLDARGHPIFQAGVRVDGRMQPLDADGAPVYENLWAAGGVLAHADAIRERSLEGIAVATGMAAGRAIAQKSSQRATKPVGASRG